ncbi:MAG: hypothetical protein P8Z81_06550, partial [Deinococcales bacterium]
MKYIVEVREPVPSNMDEIAGKVAASFNISDTKALALLRRAPGAMTKAVSEREADVVAGIFERAGLNVTRRPVGDDGTELAPAGGAEAGPVEAAEEVATGAAEPAWGGAGGAAGAGGFGSGTEPEADRAGAERLSRGGADSPADSPAESAGDSATDDDVWNQPLSASASDAVDGFSRRDDFEAKAGAGWEAADWTPESSAAEPAPEAQPVEPAEPAEPARTVEPDEPRQRRRRARERADQRAAEEGVAVDVATPPEARGPHRAAGAVEAEAAEPEAAQAPPAGKPKRGRRRREEPSAPARPRGATGRSADDARLRSGGMSRRVGWVGVFPPLLALLAMGAAVVVTVTPLVRTQQASQAVDTASAEAGTLEALTGGMPLTSQTLQGPLVDLSNRSQQLLRSHGVSLMVITDQNGAPLAGWYGVART